MTAYPAKYPTWGVLVHAPVEQVMWCLLPLRDRFDLRHFLYRTSGPWTAVFNMEPGSTGDDDAAQLLKERGLVPVFRFDFNKYEDLTFRWDGTSWEQDREPRDVLWDVGIGIPGWDGVDLALHPGISVASRTASIVEAASVDEAREIIYSEGLRVEPGPRGAIVYDPDAETQIDLWHRAPQRVFEVLFYSKSGTLHVTVMKGSQCLGMFTPGATSTRDGTPFLADVEGETTPEGIVDRFGIDRSFLARLPEARDAAPCHENGSSPAKRGSSDC